MKLEKTLKDLAGKNDTPAPWKPLIFDLDDPLQHESMQSLLLAGEVPSVHDHILDQITELLRTRDPSAKPSQKELDRQVAAFLGNHALPKYGRWVFYPWRQCLVHLLPDREYRELRSDRNRYKITREEQELLHGLKIGIVGLSAGRASALTLALEGVGGEYRLADFDTLSLSNMNRLTTSVDNLGLNKSVLTARDIFGIDPYLEVKIFPEGLTDSNLDDFLTGGAALDVLIEECDDLFMKVRLRERARELGIAVLMDTNERGLLDVERYDREPERPLFHGLLGDTRAEALRNLSKKEKVPYVMKIIGEEVLSSRSIASLVEIDNTVSSWPQLASGAALGGALACDAVRRMFLSEFNQSGRFVLDLSEHVCDGQSDVTAGFDPLGLEVSPEALRPKEYTLGQKTSRRITSEEIRILVAHATLAPSGHNVQPWRFEYLGDLLYCHHDRQRSQGLLDFENSASYLAIGAAVENLEIAAGKMGYRSEVARFPDPRDPDLVCTVRFVPDPARPKTADLFDQIARRVTNRRMAKPQPVDPQHLKALGEAAESAGSQLQLITRYEALDEVGEILGEGDRFSFLTERLHAEMMEGMRWTRKEVEATRDGLDVATLELSKTDLVGMRLARRWSAMKLVGNLGGGRTLARHAQNAIRASSAVGLVSAQGRSRESFFTAGRAMQRVWLTATEFELAIQPMTILPYLFDRLERSRGEGFSDPEKTALTVIQDRFLRMFPHPTDTCQAFLFRIARAGPPTARSLRRHLNDVLTFQADLDSRV